MPDFIEAFSSKKILVSAAFTPNFFPIGILFGIPAGFFEEIGWTGYALTKINLKYKAITASIIVGLLLGDLALTCC